MFSPLLLPGSPTQAHPDLVAGVTGGEGVPRAGIGAVEVVGRDNLRQACLAEQREHPDVEDWRY